MKFPVEYDEVLNRIGSINPIRYAKNRNYIDGAVTCLSPYISRGVISVKQVMQDVLKRGYNPVQIEKFLQELAWREYFQRVWQKKGSLIWHDLKQPQADVLHHEMITAIENGKTGIDAIDSQIIKLFETGYMHNHIRMYVASIACNIGKAHWLSPSRWMYYHLLDGDIASNTCSWQWIAGAFSLKKYYCNQDNINKYTYSIQKQTFLDNEYTVVPVMKIPGILTQTNPLQLQTFLPKTALPDLKPEWPTLLYNSYNIDPEWRKNDKLNRVLLLEPSHFEKYPVSPAVIDFVVRLSGNIQGIQLYCGEVDDLVKQYAENGSEADSAFISKEHPAFTYYPGIKDTREWMYPEVTGYHPSFFSYWKKCERHLKK